MFIIENYYLCELIFLSMIYAAPILIVFAVFMSIITFNLFKTDWESHQMRRNDLAVEEWKLFVSSALFGAPGAWLAMKQLGHKKNRYAFRTIIPTLSFLQKLLIIGVVILAFKEGLAY